VIALFTFQASLGCYERIEKYLLSEIRNDTRLSNTSLGNISENDNKMVTQGGIPLERQMLNKNLGNLAFDGSAINAENGNFGFANNSSPIIQSIQLSIKLSTLVMVIGPVGSGKSVLLRAFLGEMSSSSGLVYTSEREIAFCSQETWLPNVTIRQSVIGVCELMNPGTTASSTLVLWMWIFSNSQVEMMPLLEARVYRSAEVKGRGLPSPEPSTLGSASCF
jgi:ATP-binding cassette subfamily C (CFTR/MRP) protein 1